MTGQLQLDDKLVVWIPLAGAADLGLQRLAPRCGARGKARQRVGEALALALDVEHVAVARRVTPGCRATVRTPRSATISDTSISSRPSLTEPPSSPKPPSGGGLKGQALRGPGQGGQSETDATIIVIVTFNAGSPDRRAQAGS